MNDKKKDNEQDQKPFDLDVVVLWLSGVALLAFFLASVLFDIN